MGNEQVDDEEEEKLTPYQGEDRTFGLFRCGQCDRHWASPNSWANCGQQCKMCQTMTYPYLQRPLLRRKENKDKDINKKHPKNLCEKCVEVGSFCGFATKRPKKERRRNRSRRRRRGNQNKNESLNRVDGAAAQRGQPSADSTAPAAQRGQLSADSTAPAAQRGQLSTDCSAQAAQRGQLSADSSAQAEQRGQLSAGSTARAAQRGQISARSKVWTAQRRQISA